MKRIALHLLYLTLIVLTNANAAKPGSEQLERVVQRVIEALNSNDTEQRESILKEYYINADSASAVERWQGHLQRFSQQLGTLKIHDINVTDPSQLHVLVRTSNPRAINPWIDFAVNMDNAQADKFRSLQQGPGRDPQMILPERPLTTREIARYVSDFIDDLADRDVFSGAVSLVKDGQPFFTGAYGEANRRWGIDNKLDTKFNLGSMNKMFTGVAICQLASQKKLTFDDPISKYLPDYPNKEVADKVTIHHLLTHTSGMGSYWDAMDNMDWTGLRSVKDYADLAVNDPLAFEPGDHFQYSNSGPLVLGLIIEAISGMDYHDYVRKYISEPAGMINTDCYAVDDVIPNLAQGYFWDDETKSYHSNIFAHSARGSAAGGGFSTVEDLQRFARSLYDGTLLPADMLEIYTTGKVENGPNDSYAYLIADSRWDGHRTVGHNGGAPGINADLKIFTDLGYVITAMGNCDEAANAITVFATSLITHMRPAPAQTEKMSAKP